MLKLALHALPKDLSFEETLGKAPFERILLPRRYVLALKQVVHTLTIRPLVTCHETLWHRVAVKFVNSKNHASKYLYSYHIFIALILYVR